MKLKYYNNLDGIRAIAVLLVMFFHFFQTIKPNTQLLFSIVKLSIFGQTGVTLFFVLSGFLITRILMLTKNKEGYFKNFYLRRSLRIFPLYYLFLIFTYYLQPFIFGTIIPPLYSQVYFYIYLQNFALTFHWNAAGPGHFWSLAVEEHFYLFWPFIVLVNNTRNLFKVIIGIIVVAFILRIYMLNHGYPIFYFTFTRFDALAIGALLALMEQKNCFKTENSRFFLITAICVLLPTLVIWFCYTGKSNFSIQVYKDLLLSFFYLLFIAFVLSINENHFLNRFLESKFLSYTGKISYGMYVFHPISYVIGSNLLVSDYVILNLVIGFSITYIIASASFYLFELKFLKLKKYFNFSESQ